MHAFREIHVDKHEFLQDQYQEARAPSTNIFGRVWSSSSAKKALAAGAPPGLGRNPDAKANKETMEKYLKSNMCAPRGAPLAWYMGFLRVFIAREVWQVKNYSFRRGNAELSGKAYFITVILKIFLRHLFS